MLRVIFSDKNGKKVLDKAFKHLDGNNLDAGFKEALAEKNYVAEAVNVDGEDRILMQLPYEFSKMQEHVKYAVEEVALDDLNVFISADIS